MLFTLFAIKKNIFIVVVKVCIVCYCLTMKDIGKDGVNSVDFNDINERLYDTFIIFSFFRKIKLRSTQCHQVKSIVHLNQTNNFGCYDLFVQAFNFISYFHPSLPPSTES